MADRSEVNNEFLRAFKLGILKEIQNLIDHYGLSYLPYWSQGYFFLRKATEQERTKMAKLLLRNGCRVNSKGGNPSMTPLHFAARSGDAEVVEMLLDKGAHINARARKGKTPLAFAIEGEYITVAEHLLNHGATVDVTSTSWNWSSQKLLHIACRVGHEKLVEILLRNHVYVNATDPDGSTPLHIAVQHENLKVVEHLLIYGADIDSACILRGKAGYTALHVAAQTGNEESIKLLLSKGSTIDARTEDKLTPLHIAIKNARQTFEITKICLEHGADVNAKSVDNQTPLNLAVEKSSLTIIREILRYKPDPNDEHNRLALCSAVRKCGRDSEKIVADLLDYGLAISPRDIIDGSLLYAAVKNGYEKIVEDLLKYGADANYSGTETSRKRSLLHTAIEKGRDSMINLLINYGADVNSKDSTGRTPIYLAVENQNLEATKQLLHNKANIEDRFDILLFADGIDNTKIVETLPNSDVAINTFEKKVETVLHTAVRYAREEIVKLLLDYSADINSDNSDHFDDLLFLAVFDGNKSITTMILDKGANVDAVEADGLTALQIACFKRYTEVVEILLKYGAEPNCGENKDAIPLHAATINKHTAIVEILLRYGAEIDLKNDNGMTALHIASQKGFENIFYLLLEHGSDVNCVTKDNHTVLDYAIIGRKRTYAERVDVIQLQFCENDDIARNDYFIAGEITTHEIIFNYLQCHMIKLAVANLYLIVENFFSIDSSKFGDLPTDCEKEIKNMESEKISNNISFYDILTKGVSQLSAYARNENVRQALTTNDYKTKFPIYASMINLQFEKGMKRNDLLEPTYRSLDILCDGLPMLPHLCVDKILTNLSNYDLKNLINASKATNISYLTK